MISKFLNDGSDALFVSSRRFKHILAPLYLGMFIVLAILPFISLIIYGDTLFFYYDFSDQHFGVGAVTVIGSMYLVVTGVFFLVTSRLFFLIREPSSLIIKSRRWWLAAGIGGIYLGFDEILMIHEFLTRRMNDIGIPKPFGIDQDVYIFLIYGVAALMIVLKLLPSIFYYRQAILPLVAVPIFFGISQAVDFIPWNSLPRTQQMVFGPIEEIFKTMGEWSFLLYAGLLVEEVIIFHASAIFQRH